MLLVELNVLRVIHILGGTFWVGSALFMTLFLAPALEQSGANAGPIMSALRDRRLMTYLPISALLTIASGARLMWLTSAGFAPGYFRTVQGGAYATAGAAAVVAFLFAMFIARPAAMQAARLGQSLGSLAEAEASTVRMQLTTLRRRNTTASAAVTLLLVLGSAGMAVARYLPSSQP